MEQSPNLLASQGLSLYGEEYYRSHLGPDPYDRSNVAVVEFFAVVADQIIRSLRPARVLDAGCALGFLVEAFWDRGVEAWGIDISEFAISKVRRDMAGYCRVASLTQPLEGTYDLITCVEVLEHLSEEASVAAIGNLAKATDTILFSSSPTDLAEPTHINVHQPLWWMEQFQQAGFAPDLRYDAGFITPHAFLLRKTEKLMERDVLRLFAELLRFKLAHTEHHRTVAGLQREVDGLRALESPPQGSVRGLIERVQNTIKDQASELAEMRQGLSSLMDRHVILLRELERAAGAESIPLTTSTTLAGVRSEIESLRADIAAVRDTSQNTSSGLDRSRSETAAVREEMRLGLAGLSRQLDHIVQSRIWRTLTRAGAVLLRFGGVG